MKGIASVRNKYVFDFHESINKAQGMTMPNSFYMKSFRGKNEISVEKGMPGQLKRSDGV